MSLSDMEAYEVESLRLDAIIEMEDDLAAPYDWDSDTEYQELMDAIDEMYRVTHERRR